ncbi:MAG: NAD(P)H-dependent oxidoreductase [Sedimentisphaerales bacterium]|nr:NAD(P)H-dependent oxidoreductase [Sedimentisphaerales bacterium]
MKKILYIEASPRKKASYSIRVAQAFLTEYRQLHPKDKIVSLNIFERDLPDFSGPALEVKYAIMHGLEVSEEQKIAWNAVESLIEEFKSADKYVWAVPMWNFGIPYRLKQYIDILIQPGYTFDVTPEGYQGLVTGKPAFVAYARGGEYIEGEASAAADMQKPYLEFILGFIGLTDIRRVIVQPTLQGRELGKEKLEAACAQARQLAKTF